MWVRTLYPSETACRVSIHALWEAVCAASQSLISKYCAMYNCGEARKHASNLHPENNDG